MYRPPDTIPALIDDAAAAAPQAPALICGDRVLSFGGLATRSNAVAAALEALGIGAGDVVLIWVPNEPAWLEIFIACTRLGAIAFAVNLRFREAEIADILDRTRARAIVYRSRVGDTDFDALFAAAAANASWRPPVVLTLGREPSSGAVSYDELVRSQAVPFPGLTAEPAASPDPDSPIVLFATSGTTSRPKFVQHSQRSIARHAEDVAKSFGLAEDGTVLLQALPYSGVFGFCQAMAALAARRPSVVPAAFDAAEAANLIRERHVTHFNATDEMLALMVAVEPAAATYRTLKLVGAASFSRGPEALARIARAYDIPVVGLYGMSEIQALYARRSLDDPEPVRFQAGGRPVSADASVRCRDPETGEPAGEGGGELECSGPSLFSGYFGDEGADAAAIEISEINQ